MKFLSSTKFQLLCIVFFVALSGLIITAIFFTTNPTLAAPAAAKLQGYQIVSASAVSEETQDATAAVSCPAGKKVLGGSSEVTSSGESIPGTTTDKPTLDGSGWTAKSSYNVLPYTLTVYAICAKE